MGMAGAAIALTGVSTAFSMYSSYQQAQIATAAGRRNALLARQAAEDATARGEIEASRVRSAGVRDIAKAKATMLAQGQYAEGSGLADLLSGMALNIETDAETIKNNAARQAWGYRNAADTSLFEGQVAASRAMQDMLGAGLSGLGRAVQIGASMKGKDGLVDEGPELLNG